MKVRQFELSARRGEWVDHQSVKVRQFEQIAPLAWRLHEGRLGAKVEDYGLPLGDHQSLRSCASWGNSTPKMSRQIERHFHCAIHHYYPHEEHRPWRHFVRPQSAMIPDDLNLRLGLGRQGGPWQKNPLGVSMGVTKDCEGLVAPLDSMANAAVA